MKRWAIRLTAFFVTVALGFAVTAVVIKIVEGLFPYDLKTVPEIKAAENERPVLDDDVVPTFDNSIDYTKSLPVKLLQTGEYHSEEVPYRTGERWLGLFRVGDRYELKRTSLTNRAVKEEGLYDREISVSDSNEPVFLLKNAKNLNLGEIETVFDVEHNGPFDFLAKKRLGLRGSFWQLWIESPSSDGLFQKGSSLVLKRSGMDQQVLRTLPEGCDDCSWELLWSGDLDRDGNLDFLIDLSGHYNVSAPTLFLSSLGSDVGFVGIYASLKRVGC